MHQRLILIETSTALCSTALAEDGAIVSSRFSDTPRAHASMTAVFISEMLNERGLRAGDCDAVCLSMGPGSYTGLRVGSSTAKGLCFGGGIPLLAVGTLDVLAAQAIEERLPEGCRYIVPMIDARRMEVYTSVYTADGQRLTDVAPLVVEGPESLDTLFTDTANKAFLAGGNGLDENGILFIGDGAGKCEALLGGPGRCFRQECPRAESMLMPAMRELLSGNFRDIAYFEPFYLKDFVATVAKNPLRQ